MNCGSITKAEIGKRMLWQTCGLAYDHDGLHWDTKHNHRWDSPMIRHGDFERGSEKENRRPKKVWICFHCKRHICECSIGGKSNARQTNWLRERAENIEEIRERNEQMDDLYASQGLEAYFGEY